MINSERTFIEVPPFDLPVILMANAVLWVAIAGVAAVVF